MHAVIRHYHFAPKESLRQLGKDAGLSDSELKELVEDGKKLERDS